MKSLRHFIFIFAAILLIPGTLQAQVVDHSTEQSDLRFRTGFSIDKKVIKGLHITWSEELRLKNKIAEIDRIYSALSVSYEVFPWLKAGADYTFIAVKQFEGWEFRNRSNLDVTGSHKFGQWKFSLRERFRVTSSNKPTDPRFEINPSWIMRSRLMAEYCLRCCPLKPYAFFELSNTLNTPSILSNYIDNIRFSIGVKYAISPRSEFDFYYRFDHTYSKEITWATDSTPWIITTEKQSYHILGVFYKYSF